MFPTQNVYQRLPSSQLLTKVWLIMTNLVYFWTRSIIFKYVSIYLVFIIRITIIGYFRTAKGKLCSEDGDLALDDERTCREIAKDFNATFVAAGSITYHPKGCYTYPSEEIDHAYFNRHSNGSSNSNARQICKHRGKG